ncbi:hypothetical protein ACH9L7_05435 [Haloferax sp. S1W]|uniref:hypothetical protein n=1 Tax=Haloferax sp. S1W TaxID=3377110 RepID=UPI0037CAB4D4
MDKLLDEPDWLTVLRIFWEENIGFEYSPDLEWEEHVPEHPDLEGIDAAEHAQNLLRSGHLGVEELDLRYNSSAPIDYLDIVRVSDKGLQAIRDRETLEIQAKFEREQSIKSNKVNSAIGYLTIGLLIVTLSDMVLATNLTWIPTQAILFVTLLLVLGLIYKISKSGLLDTY